MVNWQRMVYVTLLVLIYIPMAFMGTNVFFSDPHYQDYYYPAMNSCYSKIAPVDETKLNATEWAALQERRAQCDEEQRQAQIAWQAEKRSYDGQKYVFLAAFNLLAMLLLILIPHLEETVTLGLFLGAGLTTAFATMIYNQTDSKIGFGILIATFVLILAFINHRRALFFESKAMHKVHAKK